MAGNFSGEIKFYQRRNGILVEAHVSGLPENNPAGFFAMHIHEGDSCTGKKFSDSGSHLNLGQMPHPEHTGDLPPLLSCNGEAYMSVLTNRFNISDIIGRTVIIHSGPDDFNTQPAGNPGTKIACGVIRSS